MTLSAPELWFYALTMFLLFLTPGPVWVALIARGLSGGFSSAWPLAVGVAIGDLVWPLAAIFGMSWVLSTYEGAFTVMKWAAAGIFVIMGVALIRHAGQPVGHNSRLTRPGRWQGFVAGLAVIAGNPKAILFYMGVLPGFFDLTAVNGLDIAMIVLISGAVPMAGNLAMALSVDKARRWLSSSRAVARLNITSGVLLLGVAVAIAVT